MTSMEISSTPCGAYQPRHISPRNLPPRTLAQALDELVPEMSIDARQALLHARAGPDIDLSNDPHVTAAMVSELPATVWSAWAAEAEVEGSTLANLYLPPGMPVIPAAVARLKNLAFIRLDGYEGKSVDLRPSVVLDRSRQIVLDIQAEQPITVHILRQDDVYQLDACNQQLRLVIHDTDGSCDFASVPVAQVQWDSIDSATSSHDESLETEEEESLSEVSESSSCRAAVSLMQPCGFIEMGQGLVCDGDARLVTSRLDSCTFIAGFNANTGASGAYHYGAETFRLRGVQADMTQWLAALQPTRATLVFAKAEGPGRSVMAQSLFKGASTRDRKVLLKWLATECNPVVTTIDANSAGMECVAGLFRVGTIGDLGLNVGGATNLSRCEAGDYIDDVGGSVQLFGASAW